MKKSTPNPNNKALIDELYGIVAKMKTCDESDHDALNARRLEIHHHFASEQRAFNAWLCHEHPELCS